MRQWRADIGDDDARSPIRQHRAKSALIVMFGVRQGLFSPVIQPR